MQTIKRTTEPFFLKGGKTACLLIHGFTGSPGELRPLGEFLAQKGYTVKGVLLKGHGSTSEEMEKTNWHDWYKSAEEGYFELKKNYSRIIPIGFSMGGLLAMRLASKYSFPCLVAISSPIYVVNKKAMFASIIKYFKRFEPKKPNTYLEKDMKEYVSDQGEIPVRCVESLIKLISDTKTIIPQIKAPVLIVQSKMDATVDPRSAEYIYKKIGSTRKELFWLERSGHLVVLDKEREKLFTVVEEFIKKVVG
ncbi:MAG: carboxylesterase [Thermosediminibacterales bacterium]|nr:carboxylesterase [Thermosediminibacterales bacterium]